MVRHRDYMPEMWALRAKVLPVTADFSVRFGTDQRWTTWQGWPPAIVMRAWAATERARQIGFVP